MLLWVMKMQSMGRNLGHNYIITEFKGGKFNNINNIFLDYVDETEFICEI